MELTEKLKEFIEKQEWNFAKTYVKTWPHEYIFQERVDNDLYLELANHIGNFGYESYFYKTKQIYFEYNGFTYWYMENIINRCVVENIYHEREKSGSLPENFKRIICNHY